MIRKFNYTGRKKIKRSAVHIELLRDPQNQRLFNIDLHISDMGLPESAHVYVEAYHRSGYQRYDFGTVGNLRVPFDRRLKHFSASAMPLFRVKIVDRTSSHGRILAAVDKLRPESVDDMAAGSRSLLFVEYDDLGNRIWQLDLDGDWPVLRLNYHLDEIAQVASRDYRFLSLVYPEVFRQILRRIVIEDQHTDPRCDDDWPSLWLQSACRLPGMPPPPQVSRPDQQAWVEKAVEAFCANFKMLEKFHLSLKEQR